jgi:hypothetical protein
MEFKKDYNWADKLKIDRHLVLNLSHITKEDNDLLEDSGNQDYGDSGFDVYHYEHGHIVCMPKDVSYFTEFGFSTFFESLAKMAQRFDCNMITLDINGYIYEEMPLFKWED